MSMFCVKKLSAPVKLHEQLRRAREGQHIEQTEVAFRTRIPLKYICAMDEGKYEKLPHAQVYRSVYMREYADVLGLNKERCLDQLEAELRYRFPETTPRSFTKKYLHNALLSRVFRRVIIFSGVFLLVVYLGWQVKGIMDPPRLSVLNPVDGAVQNSSVVSVEGTAESGNQLTVNGRAMMMNEKGEFNTAIDLSPGLNTIIVSVAKKHGKTTVVTRHVIVKELSLLEIKK